MQLSSVIALIVLMMVPSACLAAEDEEAQRKREQQELASRNFLYERFMEIGQKAENRNDQIMAVGMYEAALERTSRKESNYETALNKVIQCYTALGYYWRLPPLLDKQLTFTEQSKKPASEETMNSFRAALSLFEQVGSSNSRITIVKRQMMRLEALRAASTTEAN